MDDVDNKESNGPEEVEDVVESTVQEKVNQMGGLIDKDVAEMLIEYEQNGKVQCAISDVKVGSDEEVRFIAKVMSIGQIHEFDKEGEEEKGYVLNVELADETGRIRAAFWNEYAKAIEEELEIGQVLRIQGFSREREGEIEVSVNRSIIDEDTNIRVDVMDECKIGDLISGGSNVQVVGRILSVESERTFSRSDGSEGKVASITISDETGRIRLVLWDKQTQIIESITEGKSIEVTKGYIRKRESQLELHVGKGGSVNIVEGEVEFSVKSNKINTLEIGDTADIQGVIVVADPTRVFDRKDGTKGQVRNIRIQDGTGEIRMALWDEKADIEIGPGDKILCTDILVKEGWQEDLEASTNWKTSISILERSE
jgi:ssDNA-binding replication factor A large subunit